jgi:hypothetical protein
MAVPDRSMLVIGQGDDRQERAATVAWRGFNELGVTFE